MLAFFNKEHFDSNMLCGNDRHINMTKHQLYKAEKTNPKKSWNQKNRLTNQTIISSK
ncbi:hypothetical protein M153_2100055759 [Pseudoloma neurophilia]|uniref:Uncharacterized protein n=1 Tax=Pseudoloma neurophilia TaxID=146866 RepID=A0A0R0M0W3_9MICR|nr:hypothetical protein M153_2100055759 [Pseudoloma neurophilia]